MEEKTTSKKKQIIIGVAAVVVVAALLFFLTMLPKLSQTSDPEQPVAAEQNIIVTVKAESIEDLYGYQFNLNYDSEELEYAGTITSKVDDIQTIFSKPKDGFELVGATMVGDKEGVSGTNMVLCEMIFTAKKDGVISDFACSLSDVSIVKPDMEYLEDVEGWTCSLSLQAE